MDNLHPYNFFFELPLYGKILIKESDENSFLKLINIRTNLDAYNPLLKENTTYRITSNSSNLGGGGNISFYTGITNFELNCVRSNYKITCFALLTEIEKDDKSDFVFQKIGQYPSIADLQISRIRDFSKVLSKEKLKEITRAVGLAANGVGIGSFVYLRRVFEDLVEQAHQVVLVDKRLDEEEYSRSRMVEKIALLAKYLPKFLVDNKNLYGIMSKGIHELSEQDCLIHFDVVKVGIEFILEEKIEEYNRNVRLAEAQRKIQEASQKINSK